MLQSVLFMLHGKHLGRCPVFPKVF